MDDDASELPHPHPVLARVGEAIALGQQGERRRARVLLEEAWSTVGPDGDPLHRCAIAHSLADVQDDVASELVWDVRALEAGRAVTDEQVAAAGMPGTARSLLPSLHLNLADAHARLGQWSIVGEHVALGRAALDALPDDGYAAMIRSGLDRVADEVDRHDALAPP